MLHGVLVRYGSIHEVARFTHNLEEFVERGTEAVVQSHRGLEIGVLLEPVKPADPSPGTARVGDKNNGGDRTNGNSADEPRVLRRATDEDLACQARLREECDREFDVWRARIKDWNLQLELIDIEWTLDRKKLILYVLNERGPESTKLALAAAAAGLGLIEVQPVTADGPLHLDDGSGGSGCGAGGCGCGS